VSDTALDMVLELVSGLALGTASDRGWGKVLDTVLGMALEAVLVTASDEGLYPNKLIPSLGFRWCPSCLFPHNNSYRLCCCKCNH